MSETPALSLCIYLLPSLPPSFIYLFLYTFYSLHPTTPPSSFLYRFLSISLLVYRAFILAFSLPSSSSHFASLSPSLRLSLCPYLPVCLFVCLSLSIYLYLSVCVLSPSFPLFTYWCEAKQLTQPSRHFIYMYTPLVSVFFQFRHHTCWLARLPNINKQKSLSTYNPS